MSCCLQRAGPPTRWPGGEERSKQSTNKPKCCTEHNRRNELNCCRAHCIFDDELIHCCLTALLEIDDHICSLSDHIHEKEGDDPQTDDSNRCADQPRREARLGA